jgi:hypothetical protein
MKLKKIAPLLPVLLFANSAWSQYKIRCTVMDTLNSRPAIFASVVAIRSADSVIETYARADGNGMAVLNVPREGSYIVRITYPGFAEYHDQIKVAKPITDLDTIAIVSKERLLKEVVVTRQIAAIKIKGDTTEYVADSFRTKENATVEDLLKKLPGIQVDKDGKITAQGTEVKKILVDGEEFFSDDPKVVTKGLQADALDKVQVFDKKSDQAEFTGIDDGEKTKTINLELKEDKKKGYFGKLDAGGGTDGYFQNQAMLNAFKKKRQFSAFGIVSNTDKAGLGWSDNEKFGGNAGMNTVYDDGNMYTYSTSSEDDFSGWNGKYDGEGLPKTWTGGMHFADKWNKDKYHLSSNYRAARQNVEIAGTTVTQYSLPIIQTAAKTQFSNGDKNGADVMFDWTVDSTTSIKVTADGGHKNMKTLTNYTTTSQNLEGIVQTINNRSISGDNTGDFLNASLLLKKKFAKKGRTFSADFRENYKQNENDGFLNSLLAHRDTATGTTDTLLTAQRKSVNNNSVLFSGKVVYTEPLSKISFLEANFSVTANNSFARNYSFNKDGAGESLDSIYSSNYQYNILTNRGGIKYKYVKDKINFGIGTDFSNAHYTQEDKLRGVNSIERNYPNIFPSANLNYKLKKQTSISLGYQGNTRQPTISEIQPLKQNIDPLNQTIGNPGLRQEFSNRINLNFNDYKVLTGQYIWISANFRSVNDAISTRQTVSPSGNTMQYINVDGNYTMSAYGGGGFKIKKPAMYVGGQLSTSLSHYNNVINDTANVSTNNSYDFGPYINWEKEEKFEMSFNPSFSWNQNKSSITRYSNNYWSMNVEFSGSVKLPKKFEVSSSVSVFIRQKTDIYTQNNNVVRWNAWVSKKLLKKSQLEVRASVFDILNQNIGYSREAQNGIVTENRYNTIMRYGMLNLIWNFTHSPVGAAPVEINNED